MRLQQFNPYVGRKGIAFAAAGDYDLSAADCGKLFAKIVGVNIHDIALGVFKQRGSLLTRYDAALSERREQRALTRGKARLSPLSRNLSHRAVEDQPPLCRTLCGRKPQNKLCAKQFEVKRTLQNESRHTLRILPAALYGAQRLRLAGNADAPVYMKIRRREIQVVHGESRLGVRHAVFGGKARRTRFKRKRAAKPRIVCAYIYVDFDRPPSVTPFSISLMLFAFLVKEVRIWKRSSHCPKKPRKLANGCP